MPPHLPPLLRPLLPPTPEGGPDRYLLKALLNLANGSTLLGILLARIGHAELRPGPRGLLLGSGYQPRLPAATAFTVGNVVTTRRPEGYLEAHPRLLAHEERHTWQYVACLGLPMIPLYLLGAVWSLLRGGDVAVHNPFECAAGLTDGGYPLVSARERRARAPLPRRH